MDFLCNLLKSYSLMGIMLFRLVKGILGFSLLKLTAVTENGYC